MSLTSSLELGKAVSEILLMYWGKEFLQRPADGSRLGVSRQITPRLVYFYEVSVLIQCLITNRGFLKEQVGICKTARGE